MKPTIYVIPGEIAKIIDSAEFEMAKLGQYFQSSNCIVVVSTEPATKETTICPIKKSGVRVAVSIAANWERYDSHSESFIRIDPPAQYPNSLYDMHVYNHLPVLRGLARQPYLRKDHSLMQSPGYDALSFMYGVFNPNDFRIPQMPSLEEAKQSLVYLQSLLEEFSFKDETDKAATLAAILTASIRVSIPKAPLFHVSAPQIGSGKSYLTNIISAFCAPHSVAPTTFPQDEEECKKLLLASLLTSPAVINFDNLTTDIMPFPSLCAVLTEEFFSARILGISKDAKVSTRTLFLSSGNNVGPIQDMGRRCITITLDPRSESPTTKDYKRPYLLPELIEKRGEYVSAALTIIMAWIAAGRPKQSCKPLASYTEWADLCCQPLMWLGLPNPMTSIFKAMEDDPERKTIERIISRWDEVFGKQPTMVRNLIDKSYNDIELREILEDIAPDNKTGINNKSLGRWLKRHEYRVVNGLRLIPDDGKRSAQAWRIDKVS